MNFRQLVERVANETGQSPASTAQTLRTLFDVIAQTMAAGERAVFTHFGTFESYERISRTARNPQTGERVQIPAHQAPRFRPAKRLRDMVRTGDTESTTRKAVAGRHVQKEAP